MTLSAAGGGWLAWLVNQSALKLPVVFVVETDYPAPFLPNSWVADDVAGFESLADGEMSSARSPWAALRGTLDHRSPAKLYVRSLGALTAPSGDIQTPESDLEPVRRAPTAVIVLSALGLVNSAGEPCLATATSDPLDEQTWQPFSRVVTRLRQQLAPADADSQTRRVTLLILDAVRHAPLWEANQFDERFVEAVQRTLPSIDWQDLIVLTSSGPRQRAWGAPELQGTVFGHFLRLGLAGLADLPRSPPPSQPGSPADLAAGGNGDGWVTLGELQDYLTREVDAWASRHRGVRQLPQRLSAPADPQVASTRLTRSLPAGRLQALREEANAGSSWGASRNFDDALELAWKTVAELEAAEPGRDLLVSLPALRRKLCWIEESLDSGSRASDRVLADLSAWQRDAEQRLKSLRNDSAMAEAASSAVRRVEQQIQSLVVLPDAPRAAVTGDGMPGSSTSTEPAWESLRTLATLADEAARIPDPRVAPWVNPLLQAGDAARRRVENFTFARALLLSGSTESWTTTRRTEIAAEAAADIEQAREAYRRAIARRDLLAAACLSCDLWLATLPSIARTGDQLPGGNRFLDNGADPSAISPSLDVLWRQVLQLRRTLDRPWEPGQAAEPPRQVSDDPLGDGERRVREQFAELLGSDPDAAEAASLETPGAAGQTSDPSGRMRARLLLDRLTRNWEITLASEPGADLDSPGQEIAPRLAALAGGFLPAATTSPEVRARARMELRRQLIRLAARSPRASQPQTPPSQPPAMLGPPKSTAGAQLFALALETAAPARTGIGTSTAGNDFLARLAAAFPARESRSTAFQELRDRAARQELFLARKFQIERQLADNWGTVEGVLDRQTVLDSQLDGLGALLADEATEERQSVHALRAQFQEQATAFQRGASVSVEPVFRHPGVVAQSASVKVKFPRQRLAEEFDQPAVVVLRDQNERALGSAVVKWPSVGIEIVDVKVPVHPSIEQATLVTATLFFRGHERRFPVPVKASPATTTQSRPRPAPPSTVLVRRGDTGPQSLTFLLDCSASMREEAPLEGADAVLSRLETARSTLLEILPGLAEGGQARVGVMLYGHRVGWSTREPGQLLTQSAYDGAIPDNLKPYEDVESILPLGRFDASVVDRVRRRLAAVKPWGESPLYLAISRAIDEMRRSGVGRQRTLIAITDGLNYQFNPPLDLAPGVDTLIAQARDAGVRICVVGFGIRETESRQSQQEFTRLAEQTGGEYRPATRSQELLDSLRRLLGPTVFQVRAPGFTRQSDLGRAVELPPHEALSETVNVSWDELDQSIRLESFGGEAFELITGVEPGTWRSSVYDRGAPRVHPLRDSSDSRSSLPWQLAVHTPRRDGAQVEFLISVRRTDGRVPSRPLASWTEVTPLGEEGRPRGPHFIFQDSIYLPRTPNPVLQLTAPVWPVEARRARVRTWLAQRPLAHVIVPARDIPAAPTGGQDSAPEDWRSLEGSNAIAYRLTRTPLESGARWRIEVEERLQENELPRLMCQLTAPGSVVETSRVYVPLAARVVHRFVVAVSSEAALDQVELRLADSESLKQAGLALEQPVEVTVPQPSESLPADAEAL